MSKENEKLSPLVRELPRTHNTIIFSRCKTTEEREFYMNIAIKDNLSKRELERQIGASQFERTMIGNQKLSTVLREFPPNISQTFKDSYVLEFLGLPDSHSEDEVVEYAHSRNLSPALIAEYQLQLPDKKLIQAKVHELLVDQPWAAEEWEEL